MRGIDRPLLFSSRSLFALTGSGALVAWVVVPARVRVRRSIAAAARVRIAPVLGDEVDDAVAVGLLSEITGFLPGSSVGASSAGNPAPLRRSSSERSMLLSAQLDARDGLQEAARGAQ